VAAEARSKLDFVITASAEGALRMLEGETFDCLILGDSLEHLSNPAGFLANVRSVLTKDASFLISLPNVAHWSVIRMLAQGHWQYAPGGIMDETHLHWFTLRSIADLLSALGYQIERVEADYLGGPGMPRRLLRSCRALNMDVRDMVIASQCYQYKLLGRLRGSEADVRNGYESLIDQLRPGAEEAYWRYELADGWLKWLWRNYSPTLFIELGAWLKQNIRTMQRSTHNKRVKDREGLNG
jgi:SAM-dependent methyltransferase